MPEILTLMPLSPSPSTVTEPMIEEVRIQAPVKLTVTVWPSSVIVAGSDVCGKLASPKLLMVTVCVPASTSSKLKAPPLVVVAVVPVLRVTVTPVSPSPSTITLPVIEPVGGGGRGSSPHALIRGTASNVAAATNFVNLLIPRPLSGRVSRWAPDDLRGRKCVRTGNVLRQESGQARILFKTGRSRANHHRRRHRRTTQHGTGPAWRGEIRAFHPVPRDGCVQP